MHLRNSEVASIFETMADILEFKGENQFKIMAYRKGARIIAGLVQDIEGLAESGELKDVPGIGKAIADKTQEYLKTGRISKLEELKIGLSDNLIALMRIPGLGPKSLAILNRELGVENIDDLKRAIGEGKILELSGFGKTRSENILRGIESYEAMTEK
jgi:DNA polymerase (family 10)